MPRASDGSVTMPIGNPVVSGTAISSSVHNSTIADIYSMLEDSLSRTGKGGMTVPIGFDAGSVGVPGIGFDGDSDTGIYRYAANQLGIACGGSDSAHFDASGAHIPGTLEVTGGSIFHGSMNVSGVVTFDQAPIFNGGIGSISRSSLPSVGQVTATQVDVLQQGSKTPATLTNTAVLASATGRPVIVCLQPASASEDAGMRFYSQNATTTNWLYLYRKVNSGPWTAIASWRFDCINGETAQIVVGPYLDNPGSGNIQYAYYYRVSSTGTAWVYGQGMVPIAYEL